MITEIGIVAGEIWHQLDHQDTATLKELAASLKRPQELVLMSLGWLAREGHIHLDETKKGYTAKLIQQSTP